MSLHEPQPAVESTVDLRLRVPRGTSGGLVDGVVAVLERIEGVQHAAVLGVDSMTPSPADLYVTTKVRVTVNAADAAAVRETLADGFGVTDVHSVTLAEEAAIARTESSATGADRTAPQTDPIHHPTMQPTRTHTDPSRPTDTRLPPPPVAVSLAFAAALPLTVYLLAHPVTATLVVLTAATTAAVVDRTGR